MHALRVKSSAPHVELGYACAMNRKGPPPSREGNPRKLAADRWEKPAQRGWGAEAPRRSNAEMPRSEGPRSYEGTRRDGPLPRADGQRGKEVTRLRKPPLLIQPTTLWDYPSQHYGEGMQGDQRYVGATPSYVIWNMIQRYTQEGDTVVDPMGGSGTTLDVCKDTNRKGLAFDVSPFRPDITQADARKVPVPSGTAQLVFIDPPYGDHINYSDDPRCIGKLSAYDPRFYQEMGKVLDECTRMLAPGGHLGLYCCDYFEKKKGLAAVGFELFALALRKLRPVDIVSVTRHHKTLTQGNYRKAAEEGNFFLRGFNYLFILQKPEAAQHSKPAR